MRCCRPGVVGLLALIQTATLALTTGPTSVTLPAVTINRHSHGDIFSQPGGATGECSAAACLSAVGHRGGSNVTGALPGRTNRHCQCQCPGDRPVYREDVQQCVNTFEECSLADYVSGLQSEKVPFVFLPSQGQLINPQAEIALSDVRAEGQMVVSPVCVVSKAHFLTRSGWMATDNTTSASEAELPFALAREAGRTHLQWLGEPRLRSLMEGRIVLVRLLCKDTANQRIGVFSPCIAFRVAGSPGFVDAMRVGSGIADNKSGLRQADYLAIGISSALLGMLYVAGLIGFICYRRRRRQLENVHVKLAAGPVEELGVIRLNPLLQADAGRIGQLNRSSPDNDAPGTRSSTRSSNRSSSQDGGSRRYGAAGGNAHPPMNNNRYGVGGIGGGGQSMVDERYHQQQHYEPSSPDSAREAAFFYTRDMISQDNTRRMLFTPQYFDPDLLKSPPPAALEFLARLRGMIDVAKDRMTAKRFMPSLIDIPEELSYCSAYGSNQRLSNIGQEVRRNESFTSQRFDPAADARNNYSTLKRPLKKSESMKLKSANRKIKAGDGEVVPESASAAGVDGSPENKEDGGYLAVELLGANFLQKSPLPGRKSTGLTPDAAQLIAGHASIYTNPSIEEIYRSLDRSQQTNGKHQPPQYSKPKPKLATVDSCDSDAVSDLVSEAESKLPKIDGLNRNKQTYFEPDSLDRRHDVSNSRHIYQKKPPRWSKRYHHPDTNDEMREADEQSSSAAGYASSTCTSVQSLSRVLPAEEAMEIGNQLFNMNTGATTLPRLVKPGGGGSVSLVPIHGADEPSPPSSASPTRKDHIYEKIGEKRRREKGFYLVNAVHDRAKTDASYDGTSSNDSSGSAVTVLEDKAQNKLTIRVQDAGGESKRRDKRNDDYDDDAAAFEPDTLERKSQHPLVRQDSFVADSLERPVRPVKSAIRQLLNSTNGSSTECLLKEDCVKKEELPLPGSVVSLRQIYTARFDDNNETSRNSWTPALEPSRRPASRLVSAANTEVLHRFAGREDIRPFQSLPADEELMKASSPSPPPLPLKSLGSLSAAPPPPRSLKPSAGHPQQHHHHNPPPTSKPPPPPPPKDGAPHKPPTLPPKNAIGGSSGSSRSTAETSAQTSLGDNEKLLCNNFILSDSSGSRRSSTSGGSGSVKSPNVLERIAQIEREENRISSASKGMEIAMSLKARMGHLEGSLKDHKKTLSIKKTWRKLLDKVEDSFSETESASSTLRRPSSKLLGIKSLPPPPPSDDESDDDRSRSSLGSDGTGSASVGVAASIEPSTPVNIKLKSYYTFGEDGRIPSPLQSIAIGKAAAAAGNTNTPLSARLSNNRLRSSASYDSGLYSGNYSAYIGDY